MWFVDYKVREKIMIIKAEFKIGIKKWYKCACKSSQQFTRCTTWLDDEMIRVTDDHGDDDLLSQCRTKRIFFFGHMRDAATKRFLFFSRRRYH